MSAKGKNPRTINAIGIKSAVPQGLIELLVGKRPPCRQHRCQRMRQRAAPALSLLAQIGGQIHLFLFSTSSSVLHCALGLHMELRRSPLSALCQTVSSLNHFATTLGSSSAWASILNQSFAKRSTHFTSEGISAVAQKRTVPRNSQHGSTVAELLAGLVQD